MVDKAWKEKNAREGKLCPKRGICGELFLYALMGLASLIPGGFQMALFRTASLPRVATRPDTRLGRGRPLATPKDRHKAGQSQTHKWTSKWTAYIPKTD